MANTPTDRRYTKDHEWVLPRGGKVLVGISDHAQKQLGDIVFVELPKKGDKIDANKPFGSVESVKSVSEVYAPLAGTVSAVNETLDDSPEQVNDDPYGDGWMVEFTPSDPAALDALLSADEYADFIKEGTDG
ncbi:glycine cleavage system protein GcvH [Streptomyces sp. CB01881]|uniref:glycine cleavage system protein GcvH n=1 Tax=Streptomyces sp. CB01881 TaxID=2078691 RepID=UPI000CDBF753|nr:glycine cleavage system protein GcvH [Streptomyces sp. CB01881]AUY51221.1 glycine cleavage system protein H [Streptomyces sp. CB01881]TYC74608.1 glycine cleavage system protein GcvH [Streptomyces sp. CB01881]